MYTPIAFLVNRPDYQTGELSGSCDRRSCPCSDDHPGDSSCCPLFTVLINDFRKLLLAESINQISSRRLLVPIHPHIQWTAAGLASTFIESKAETTLG